MKINQFLSRRLAIVASLVLGVFLIVAVSEATINISKEKSAVANLLLLTEKINDLKSTPPELFDQKLSKITSFTQSAEFRHIDIKIKKNTGQVITENSKEKSSLGLLTGKMISKIHNLSFGEPEPKLTHSISIRHQNETFDFELTPNDISEQSEAGALLLMTITMLACLAGLTYLGIKLTLNIALNPLKDALFQLQRLSKNQYQGILKSSKIYEVRKVNEAINILSQSLIDLEKSRQMLSAKLISAQEDERARISRELHDELGQQIAVIRFNAGYLEKTLDNQHDALQAIKDIQSAIKDIDLELRELLKSLRSDQNLLQLNNDALRKILLELIKTWQEAPGQTTRFHYTIDLGRKELSARINLILFRITQEALTNIAKHANAKNVTIKITAKNNSVDWSVIDDGVGIQADDKTSHQKGNGLAGLQERLWSIGGTLNRCSENDGGLALSAKIPFEPHIGSISS